jgi:hypothetical protein
MFSSQLKPFFYLWHFFPAMTHFKLKICDSGITLANVALLNAAYYDKEAEEINLSMVRKMFPSVKKKDVVCEVDIEMNASN